MFNNSIKLGDTTDIVTFNTPCTGIIQKSHPKSKFVNFSTRGCLIDLIFSNKPRLRKNSNEIIIVLQVMAFGDGEFIVEFVYEKDINKEK